MPNRFLHRGGPTSIFSWGFLLYQGRELSRFALKNLPSPLPLGMPDRPVWQVHSGLVPGPIWLTLSYTNWANQPCLCPHEVAFGPYLKAFQYKVLTLILFTNKKSWKIGYNQDDKCLLCKTDSESLYHIFFECRNRTKQFWKKFQYYFYTLAREFVCLTLQDVITGTSYMF